MTSTNFNVGLRDGQRVSSRVLRPPGGGHTNLFGETEELQMPKNQRNSVPETIKDPLLNIDKTQPGEQSTKEKNEAPNMKVKDDTVVQEVSSVEEVKEEQVKVEPDSAPVKEPPRRIRVPPGGFSSGLW